MKKKLIGVRIAPELMDAINKRADTVEQMTGARVSVQQMVEGALRQIYQSPANGKQVQP